MNTILEEINAAFQARCPTLACWDVDYCQIEEPCVLRGMEWDSETPGPKTVEGVYPQKLLAVCVTPDAMHRHWRKPDGIVQAAISCHSADGSDMPAGYYYCGPSKSPDVTPLEKPRTTATKVPRAETSSLAIVGTTAGSRTALETSSNWVESTIFHNIIRRNVLLHRHYYPGLPDSYDSKGNLIMNSKPGPHMYMLLIEGPVCYSRSKE